MKIIERLQLALLFIALLLAFPAIGQEQETYAIGEVVTTEGKQVIRLPMVNVFWAGTTEGTTTDVDGRFELKISEATELLVFSFTGYAVDTVLYTGENLNVSLRKGVDLNTVNVVSREQSTSHFLLNPLNVQKLDGKELRKAACCNLSESFETNASIDASFTDAITGTRQIRMLGLSGRYSQILKDNIPNVRGLSTIYGLGYIPGDWIEDIHISKGAGSVTSGFESMTGEINVALKDAGTEEKAHFNVYANEGGRIELNGNAKWKVNKHWSTILLAHSEVNRSRIDRNNDGFMDNPLKQDFVLRNQWKWRADKHFEGQYSVNYVDQDQRSGQLDYMREGQNNNGLWGMHMDGERLEVSAKTGYLIDDAWDSSIGSQFSYDRYTIDLSTGNTLFDGQQNTFRGNLLYNTKLGCMKKGLTVGVTALVEEFDTQLDDVIMDRAEQVFGAYGEFTWNPSEKLSTIVGFRGDVHNTFGFMYSPRIHLRYSLTDNLSLKGAAGRGYRTFNPVTDNLGLLASNRTWTIETPLTQEAAWNYGANLTYKFKIDFREATLAIDAYRTQFDARAVVDFETPGAVEIYGLNGESYSNTAQAEFSWEMMRRTDIRLAYRYTDSKTTYRRGLLQDPFNPIHRGFVNIGYETKATKKGGQWKVDATIQLIGEQRIPENYASGSDDSITVPIQNSDAFMQVHGQVTKAFKKGLEVYLGVENATSYRQDDPILNSDTPFSDSFDASQVYAPVFGRMTYLGLRWTIF